MLALHGRIELFFRSRTAVAPIERLKILMQVQGNDKVYTNMWQVCSRLATPATGTRRDLHNRSHPRCKFQAPLQSEQPADWYKLDASHHARA